LTNSTAKNDNKFFPNMTEITQTHENRKEVSITFKPPELGYLLSDKFLLIQ